MKSSYKKKSFPPTTNKNIKGKRYFIIITPLNQTFLCTEEEEKKNPQYIKLHKVIAGDLVLSQRPPNLKLNPPLIGQVVVHLNGEAISFQFLGWEKKRKEERGKRKEERGKREKEKGKRGKKKEERGKRKKEREEKRKRKEENGKRKERKKERGKREKEKRERKIRHYYQP